MPNGGVDGLCRAAVLVVALSLPTSIGDGPDPIRSKTFIDTGFTTTPHAVTSDFALLPPTITPPDLVGAFAGGVAARVRTADGAAVPGDVFMLMATEGSEAKARVFDQTPFTHARGVAADTLGSNHAAVAAVAAITGAHLEMVDLTSPPGGGSSGGLAYTIAYINVVTRGAFTGRLRVAATGALAVDDYVLPIKAIDEKSAAAHLADADVLFTPSTPSDATLALYASRFVGELFRARDTGSDLAGERLWTNYRRWGADRPEGMDVVAVRHIGDVAAYLCGAGADVACAIADTLAGRSTAVKIDWDMQHSDRDGDGPNSSGTGAACSWWWRTGSSTKNRQTSVSEGLRPASLRSWTSISTATSRTSFACRSTSRPGSTVVVPDVMAGSTTRPSVSRRGASAPRTWRRSPRSSGIR